MSYADQVFKKICKDILENGTDTSGELVRPKWPDGTPSYTIKQFGVTNVYDLRKEFPAITIRPTGLKSCMDEILWIYQRKSNNIHDLKPHIWDEWADEKGSIGKAYGFQVGSKYIHHKKKVDPEYILNNKEKFTPETVAEAAEKLYSGNRDGVTMGIRMDQMDAVLYDLKHNPFSRRIKINLWNVKELYEMRLQPCCYDLTFNVTKEPGYDKLILNATLVQRSQDMLAASNWNVAQYSILLMMVAQVSDMVPGKLLHVITDCHIYDRHVDFVKELLERPEHPAPKVYLNPEIKDFYKFTTKDLIIENYVTEPQIKNIPIAI